LYGDINICQERLIALPEDGVPDEILAPVRHESNGSLAVKERESYVPSAYDESEERDAEPMETDGRMSFDSNKALE
jgi:hypothetical protein